VRAWLHAFLLTQAIELPFYSRALAPRPLAGRVTLGLGASLLTHPVVWFAMPALVQRPYVAMAIVAESFAVLVEAGYLATLRVRAAWRWSLAANLTSVSVGLLLRELVGWP
jgi:hypothetical protein